MQKHWFAGVARGLKMKTGFNAVEIFRKYLWYLLRERKFDTEAVNDVVQLKSSLQLSDEEVSATPACEALYLVARFTAHSLTYTLIQR